MNKTLIIVESPTKSSTISKYLGKGFTVDSSMGHVRDLNPNVLSIDVNNHYKPHYEVMKDKKAIVSRLRKAAAKNNVVLLAPDPDREGEAIAYHLKELLKDVNENISRVYFNAITKKSILDAVKSPVQIDEDKVNSQQMRRLLDRLAGYKISPILQKKIGGPLSAGRVQSIALKLIVEKEKEIIAFIPEEFWTVNGDFLGSVKPQFNAKLEKKSGKKFKISNEEECNKVIKELGENKYILKSLTKKKRKRKPSPPLITSSLQQESYRRFGFGVKKTMMIAQQLYEGIQMGGESSGLITYMRTDSYRIANEAYSIVNEWIKKSFGADYLPEKRNVYGKKNKIQDAHEAIRPTIPLREPLSVEKYLNKDQFKLYSLIWERFVASQMISAEVKETKFEVANGEYQFFIKGEILGFPGFMAVSSNKLKSEELPDIKEGEELKLIKLEHKQNFTKPPARYTEASLVKILEDKGIGRPSTYASIIDTLGKRDYVSKEEKKFVPSDLGIKVSDYLGEHFSDLMSYDFTAQLEEKLDLVSEGKLNWSDGIDEFYKKLSKDLEKVKDDEKVALLTGKMCPECEKPLTRKYSYKTKGWFVGCTGYPDCRYVERDKEGQSEKKPTEKLDRECPECKSHLLKRYSPKTRSWFIGCSNYPKCKYLESLQEKIGTCPDCGSDLVKRFSRKTRRSFVACSGYPKCKYIQPFAKKKEKKKDEK